METFCNFVYKMLADSNVHCCNVAYFLQCQTAFCCSRCLRQQVGQAGSCCPGHCLAEFSQRPGTFCEPTVIASCELSSILGVQTPHCTLGNIGGVLLEFVQNRTPKLLRTKQYPQFWKGFGLDSSWGTSQLSLLEFPSKFRQRLLVHLASSQKEVEDWISGLGHKEHLEGLGCLLGTKSSWAND